MSSYYLGSSPSTTQRFLDNFPHDTTEIMLTRHIPDKGEIHMIHMKVHFKDGRWEGETMTLTLPKTKKFVINDKALGDPTSRLDQKICAFLYCKTPKDYREEIQRWLLLDDSKLLILHKYNKVVVLTKTSQGNAFEYAEGEGYGYRDISESLDLFQNHWYDGQARSRRDPSGHP